MGSHGVAEVVLPSAALQSRRWKAPAVPAWLLAQQGCRASPLPRACVPRSGALLAAQASLIALPNELLGGILRRAWAVRPPRPAAEEVRAAAGLALVCRRVRALLRARPLPLALDLSAARLSAAQRRWLLDRAQAGRVEPSALTCMVSITCRSSARSWPCTAARCCGSPACRCGWRRA